MKKWLQSLVSPSKRHALPILTAPGIFLIGEKADAVYQNGEDQFRAIKAVLDRFPMEAALTMMDLSVEAEAFGTPVQFHEHETPNVTAAIVHDKGEILALDVPEVGAGRTGEFLLAAKRCVNEFTDKPTLAGLIGPFSLAGRLLDMSKMMLLTAMEPETVHLLLEKTTRFLIEYAQAFKATGAGGLLMAEPAAGLISPKMCLDFSSNYISRIVQAVQDDSFVFVLHNCGKTEKMVPELLSTHADAIHVGNVVDITKILEKAPAEIPVMGNIDPSTVFLQGTPENVFERTTDLLQATSTCPNFVLSSGCDIPAEAPIENVAEFFRALDAYNAAGPYRSSISSI